MTSPTNRGASSRPHHILQISAGWSHSTCLTSSGDIYIWFPFSDEYISARTSDEQLNGPLTNPSSTPNSGSDDSSTSNRELKWGKVNGSVVRQMDTIPERPELVVEEALQGRKKAKDDEWANWQTNLTSKTIEEGRKVVKIASGENFVLALRASGEVWACSVMQQTPGPWIYVRVSPFPDMTTDQFSFLGSPVPISNISQRNSSGSPRTPLQPLAQKAMVMVKSNMPDSPISPHEASEHHSNPPHYLPWQTRQSSK